ncbi:Pentatricopeptide repeat [Trema orientale]|uniref:Pentatricopeptide repeat n=1 Tax=Trema orientale TaxID=63057 RepID=A0A2P5BMW7_TREOI|nr:Pentatricopeptide repeat [Trema orientale]
MSFSQVLQRAFSTSTQASSATAVSSVSTVLYRERNLKRLVQKFKKSSEAYRFRTKTGIYEDTVRRLASAKRFKWIEEILEDQKKYDDFSKEGFAVRLISLYGKSGMFDNAQKVFDEMPERNCQRTLLSFNALLAACVNSRKFDKVDGVFRELPTRLSIEPDLVSYNTVIKAFCEMGSLDSAVSVLDEMEKKGLKPDVISFNTLLNGFYAKGRFADGEKTWGLMEKYYVSPDIRSYNAKLLGLILEKKTKEAVDLISEMTAKGIEPDVFSYNLVIESFIKEDNLEGAKQWYSELKKSECTTNKTTFEKLIPFLRKKGDLELAFELCEEVFKRRFLLDAALLQRVVDEMAKASKIEQAKKLVELGKTNDYRRYRLKLPSDN